jgi:hypothetical protein
MSMTALITASLMSLLSGIGGEPGTREATAPSPMLDGDCGEYAALGARRIPMAEDVVLHVHRDAHHLWLCYDYPPGSDGTLDLAVRSAALPEPLNLHVSAALGEWPLDRPDLAPATPDSPAWWYHHGWIANPVLLTGASLVDGRVRYRFRNAPARELQLSRQRFGNKDMQVRLHVRRIHNPDQSFRELHFPADGSWLTL